MDITIETIDERHALCTRAEADLSVIGDRIGELIGVLEEALDGRGVGPHICRYLDWEDNAGTLEVARATDGPVAGTEKTTPTIFPHGRAVVALHEGPYDGLFESWQGVHAHLESEALEGRADPWEEYVNDCKDTSPEDLRVRIVWPVK